MEIASLTHCGYEPKADTLYLDNGGISGRGYLRVCSPGNSEVHSLRSCGQVFSLALLSVPPVRQLLVLFNVFSIQLSKIIGNARDLSRFLAEHHRIIYTYY